MEVGLSPGNCVLDRDLAPFPKRRRFAVRVSKQ